METLSLCIATHSLSKGNGIDVTVAEFARELAKYHNVKLAAIFSDMSVPGVEILHYPAHRPTQMRAVAKEIDRLHFDYISTHFNPWDMVATLSHTPHILHDYGLPPISQVRKYIELKQWFQVNGYRLISARRAAAVLPISGYLGREFRKKYLYRGKMDVLPAGIEFPESEPRPAGAEYGKYVLYVGRHTPYKGVHRLIKIFGEARKELGEDVHLVTIGKVDQGRYGDMLKDLAEKAGNVHMLGFVPDVWPYYAGATVYATCSAWEGEDRPVLEAQYLGKPAVTLDTCSHPEVMFHGSLAHTDGEFKDALVRHLGEARADLSIRRKVTDRYSIGSMAKGFNDIVKGMER